MNYAWKIDDFDSGVFGFKTAKITSFDLEHVKGLIQDLTKNKISYATIRVRANDFKLIHSLEHSGFILVDGLISLSIDLGSIRPGRKGLEASQPGGLQNKESAIREAKRSDLAKLKTITTNLYSGTRITNDPLTRSHANEYYKEWVENSVKGEAADSVLVWAPPKRGSAPAGIKNGEILGYVTLKKKGEEGQIPLIGVSKKARGKGIARSLLNGSFAKFKKWGIKTVNIDTQMGNIAALRAYHGVGFKIVDSHLTFRWAI